jgi:serine/threonine-protein kinase HipA
MSELPQRIKRLGVTIAATHEADLVHESTYVLSYLSDQPDKPAASLLLPRSKILYQDGDLFPSMDMNLPEGYLFQRLVDLHPKMPLTKMHLLALMGSNGIGRTGFALEGHDPAPVRAVSKEAILRHSDKEELFPELVSAYLSTGAGISGVQPKIMVPTRAAMPIPDLIVKTAGREFPHLAINEYMCLSVAKEAGFDAPVFDLSDDGTILVLERFDLDAEGRRLGFEDIAALMGRRVNDRLSNRKYEGSYEAVAEVITLFSSNAGADLKRFFEQVALSVMLRNGDAHLKNFGMLYSDADDVRLSPVFDVVTTAVYQFERPGGVLSEDRTMALKWLKGKTFAGRQYPTYGQLADFAAHVCRGAADPRATVDAIAQAMSATLARSASDTRIPGDFLDAMRQQWAFGLAYADEAGAAGTRPKAGRGSRKRDSSGAPDR